MRPAAVEAPREGGADAAAVEASGTEGPTPAAVGGGPETAPPGPAPSAAPAARRQPPLGAFLRDGTTYWLAMLLVGVLNLGFNILAARRLEPVAYGEFSAIAALVNLFLIADDTVSRAIAGVMATLNDLASAAWLVRVAARAPIVLGVAGTIVVGSLAGPLARLLHLDHPYWIWIAAAALVPGYAGSVTVGVLQGLRLFRDAGAANLLAAVLKFAMLVLLLGLGWGVTGASLATLTEVTIAWVAPVALLTWRLRAVRTPTPVQLGAHANLLSLPVALTVARLLFFNLDILMARHYLGATQAGLFAALGVAGRIIAYGTGALPPVIYPYLVRYRGDTRLTLRYLLLTLGATVAAGGAAIALFVLAPDSIVGLLFGRSFQAISPYVGWYGLAFLLYSLTYVLLHFLVARQSWWVWGYALGGSALEAAALVLLHGGIGQFTLAVTGCFGVLTVLGTVHAALLLLRGLRAERRAAPRALGGQDALTASE